MRQKRNKQVKKTIKKICIKKINKNNATVAFIAVANLERRYHQLPTTSSQTETAMQRRIAGTGKRTGERQKTRLLLGSLAGWLLGLCGAARCENEGHPNETNNKDKTFENN